MPKKKVGRKPIGAKPFATQIIVECQHPQKRKWKARAKAAGLSLSEWVRRRLDAFAS